MKVNLILLFVIIGFLGFANLVLGEIILPNPLGVNSFPALILNITNGISAVIVSLSTLMFVWAGILFVVSGGNPVRIDQARKVALYAAVGSAIALSGAGLIGIITSIIG